MQRIRLLWPHADFRRLFVSQAISMLGDKMVLVALGLLVMGRTGSTADLGLVVGAQSASLLCFLILGGVWADRLPRHRIVVVTDVARGALHALLAALVFANALTLGELLAIEVLFGAADAFFQPACTALLPQTVPEGLIQDATAATRFTQRVAGFAGPALATALVLAFGTGVPFVIDAATFLVSARLVAQLRPRPRGEDPGSGRLSLIADARAGFHEVRARPWIWVTIAVFSVYLVVAYAPYLVLGPAVAAAAYGRAAAWGWIMAGIGIGTAVGSLLGMRWRPRRPLYTAIVVTVPFGGLLVAAGTGFSLAIVLFLAVTGGTGLALFDVWWSTALAQRVPPAALARVSSYDHLGSYALLPLGVVAVGWLAQQLGASAVMTAGGALAVVVALAGLLPRETRRMGQPEAQGTARVLLASEEAANPPRARVTERLTPPPADGSAHTAPAAAIAAERRPLACPGGIVARRRLPIARLCSEGGCSVPAHIDPLSHLGATLADLREARGLSQVEVAERIQSDDERRQRRRQLSTGSDLDRIERGDEDPSFLTLVDIARAINIPLAELFAAFDRFREARR